jgi:hypothetical protein
MPLTVGVYTLLTPISTERPTGDVVKEIAPILTDNGWTQQWSSRAFNVAEVSKAYIDKEAEIIQAFDNAVNASLGKYIDNETKSWWKQEKQAYEWQANNNAPVKLIRSIALENGAPLSELVAQIITKADNYEPVYGPLLGKKQRLLDQLYALDVNLPGEIDLINAINW